MKQRSWTHCALAPVVRSFLHSLDPPTQGPHLTVASLPICEHRCLPASLGHFWTLHCSVVFSSWILYSILCPFPQFLNFVLEADCFPSKCQVHHQELQGAGITQDCSTREPSTCLPQQLGTRSRSYCSLKSFCVVFLNSSWVDVFAFPLISHCL